MLLWLILTSIRLLIGSAILYKVIKAFRAEVYFKTVLLINLLCALLSQTMDAFGLGFFSAIANFLLLGTLLKLWSSLESWKEILLIALIADILTLFFFCMVAGFFAAAN